MFEMTITVRRVQVYRPTGTAGIWGNERLK